MTYSIHEIKRFVLLASIDTFVFDICVAKFPQYVLLTA